MSSRYCSFSFIESGFDPAFTQSKISQQQQQQQQRQAAAKEAPPASGVVCVCACAIAMFRSCLLYTSDAADE